MRGMNAAATRVLVLVLLGSAAVLQAQNASAPVLMPATRSNDDSCDIGVAPAATLLLPLFEVEIDAPASTARTTLFTITNVTAQPQIARVTLWSDWAYPVFAFNLFLTGYDVQAINLYDILGRGLVAPDRGTSNASTPGARSVNNISGNPRFLPSAATNCSAGKMPVEMPAVLLSDIRSALTTGFFSLCGTTRVGGTHTWAMGYVTVDVVADCTFVLPTDPEYYSRELLFDNVLIGDYQVVSPEHSLAQGETMVHIRAIPEGGPAGFSGTNLPYTFYDRFLTPATRGFDRRQPLPSVFAARYIQGGSTGFTTDFRVWREGITGAGAACGDYINNRSVETGEFVRFDQRENASRMAPSIITSGGFYWYPPTTPTAVPISSSNSTMFAPLSSGDVGGWMYMNLHGVPYYRPDNLRRPRQNWVVVSMYSEGRYATAFNAAPLGNGCSLSALAPTTGGTGTNPIRPQP